MCFEKGGRSFECPKKGDAGKVNAVTDGQNSNVQCVFISDVPPGMTMATANVAMAHSIVPAALR